MKSLAFVLIFLYLSVPGIKCDCGAPPQVANAYPNNDAETFSDGAAVHFTCSFAYTLTGNTTYVCIGTEWQGEGMTCELTECPAIQAPANGGIETEAVPNVGSIVTFKCNVGYSIVGAHSVICQVDGSWDSAPPVCEITSCSSLSVPNGLALQVDPNQAPNSYGTKLTIACNPGFKWTGPSEVTCQANGQWSAEPLCAEVACGPLTNAGDPCVVAYSSPSMAVNGSQAFMFCSDHGTQIGPSTATCLPNGEWDVELDCQCDCKVPNRTHVKYSNVAPTGGWLKHGMQLILTCNPNYALSGQLPIVCNDGALSSEVFYCVPFNYPTTTSTTTSTSTTTPTTTTTTTKEPSTTDAASLITNNPAALSDAPNIVLSKLLFLLVLIAVFFLKY